MNLILAVLLYHYISIDFKNVGVLLRLLHIMMNQIEKSILKQVQKYFRCGKFYHLADDTYVSNFDKPVTGIYLQGLADDITDIITTIPKFSSITPISSTLDNEVHGAGHISYGYVAVAYNSRWEGSRQEAYIQVEVTAIHNKASSGVLNVLIDIQ